MGHLDWLFNAFERNCQKPFMIWQDQPFSYSWLLEAVCDRTHNLAGAGSIIWPLVPDMCFRCNNAFVRAKTIRNHKVAESADWKHIVAESAKIPGDGFHGNTVRGRLDWVLVFRDESLAVLDGKHKVAEMAILWVPSHRAPPLARV